MSNNWHANKGLFARKEAFPVGQTRLSCATGKASPQCKQGVVALQVRLCCKPMTSFLPCLSRPLLAKQGFCGVQGIL